MKKFAFNSPLLALCAALCLVGCSHEGADWKSATAADTSEAYQQFLTQHPSSGNAGQARTRIAQLQELHDWQIATDTDTRDAYEQFLTQHPDSQWAQEARIRIENFAQSGAAPAGVAAASTTTTDKGARTSPSSMATGGNAAASGKASSALSSSAHYVQLGAFSDQARAEAQWRRLSSRYAHELASLTPRYLTGKYKTHSLVRLQVAVTSRASGKALCAKLKTHGQSCVPVGAG